MCMTRGANIVSMDTDSDITRRFEWYGGGMRYFHEPHLWCRIWLPCEGGSPTPSCPSEWTSQWTMQTTKYWPHYPVVNMQSNRSKYAIYCPHKYPENLRCLPKIGRTPLTLIAKSRIWTDRRKRSNIRITKKDCDRHGTTTGWRKIASANRWMHWWVSNYVALVPSMTSRPSSRSGFGFVFELGLHSI